MRILWITYAPLGKAAELIEGIQSQSGTWVDAAACALQKEAEIELGIVCISSKNKKVYDKENKILYWGINTVSKKSGESPDNSDIYEWKKIIREFKPELIMVWGTEYANGLSIVEASEGIPVIYFIQGVIGRITDYPLGKLPKYDVLKKIGPFPMLKFIHFKKILIQQKKQKEIETQIIKKADGIITDNQWADSYYRSINPSVSIYHLPLPINKVFLDSKYNFDAIEKHSIFTIDGCNPAKGVFHLIKALKSVKKCYPDVKLYIPGRVSNRKPAFIFESPYYTYLKRLIKCYGLEKNVIFCGQLTSEQMKQHLLSCHIFVMPSCVENHSASLREAMYLGVPCVTSMVGSVPEFTQYGENVLCYRYEEESVLVDCINRIFKNDSMAIRLGETAYQSIHKDYPQDNIGKKLFEIYKAVIDNE